ncbi:hypothetical protein CEUSTIGMA_g5108.t1 [Chlamydomonas eustigma]|uniref:Phosphoacetylglucosamine mutase n=1 Tax=Chlamydomonas eustigma TaxID=1157962 RepID=A0A250X3M0_9CHLO|nr:hypothetical protein CEUSTIGMA_g5108.t1 [Chlamydomonas eustigma]|eukprot:GAX77665.1 hypothetical protein CEUSTIGMA_g5108.t1 [Chlamydomonas eustigma]
MTNIDYVKVFESSSAFPRPSSFCPSYGTAGFRADASLLLSTLFRCGLLVAARSLLLGKSCGLMITASHNQVSDNGVKLIEPDGSMLPQDWEPAATALAQCSTDQEVVDSLRSILTTGVSASTLNTPSCEGILSVLFGYDNRPSAPDLLKAAVAGVAALGVQHQDVGFVTTPMMHFVVHQWNSPCRPASTHEAQETYFETLIGAFEQLVEGLPRPPDGGQLLIDCANGVGAHHLVKVQQRLWSAGLQMVLFNTGDGQLNMECGADHVQKERVAPTGFPELKPYSRCCSVDGDADRLVYFTVAGSTSEGTTMLLLDGDKIASLTAAFIKDLLKQLPDSVGSDIKVGVIQTAYANGASTSYVKEQLLLSVECTPTGVKYLHQAAHSYDVGVYWEANGHGTVLFSAELLRRLEKAERVCSAAKDLLLLSKVINQTVGDAFSGILLVEAVLRRKAWSLSQWDGLYQDMPSRQIKLKVADRALITVEDAERKCVTPAGLQKDIDALISEYPAGSRAFVRPSGTEDAVRVYSEAPTQEQANDLACRVGKAVYLQAGGVGPMP